MNPFVAPPMGGQQIAIGGMTPAYWNPNAAPAPSYSPPMAPLNNLHNMWDPTTNPFGGPYSPQYGLGGPPRTNPFTVPSMNIGSSSWLGGNNYP